MIVITRNGKTTVITGWRAWLIGVVVFVATTCCWRWSPSWCSASPSR